jgi:dipeptidyl aminopeptidase/acylaminoacyl peptidase
MPVCFRRIIAVATLSFVFQNSGAIAQGQQPNNEKRETTGTRKDVEKRLKAAEKPQPAGVDGTSKALLSTHHFDSTAISPDGTKVAWTEVLTGKDGAADGNAAIYVKNLKTNAPVQRISAGAVNTNHAEGGLAWSPDSKRLAFLSDAVKKDQLQLYIAAIGQGAASTAPKKLTDVRGFLDAPTWSPDGKTIAVLFTQNATRSSGPLVAETPETGEIKDSFYEQRLALIDIATGKLRQISPADAYIYEYDWSPDGTHFVVTSALGNGDNNWYIAELHVLDATSGLMKSIYKPSLQIARPAWSPDGRHIAFIEGLMSDEPSVGGDIYLISADGGKATNLTPDRKASASTLAWTRDGKILFTEYAVADSAIALLDPATSSVTDLWHGSETITAGLWGPNLSLAADGKTSAVIRHSFSAPPEVWAGPIGEWKQLTERNKGLTAAWGEVKSINWKTDQYDVQGWLIYPKDFDPSKKYPMIVDVHGGPGAAVLSGWPNPNNFVLPLTGAGYFVFQPNPRGSFGQGETFTRANVKDFGYGDWKDILAGVDEAIKVAPVDPNRLGLTGWSYGGYMTMWGVTQTDRFKAAMAGAGIANWQSYYGENKIDQWMIPFFGKSVYDDPEVYTKSAPLSFIKKAKTPTLILVGDSDGECPTPQSYEFWHALKTLGVETTLVVYEHEGHIFANPAHDRDRTARTKAWFDAHLR